MAAHGVYLIDDETVCVSFDYGAWLPIHREEYEAWGLQPFFDNLITEAAWKSRSCHDEIGRS